MVSLVLMELMGIMVAVPLLDLLDLLVVLVVLAATDLLVVVVATDLLGNLVAVVNREIIISREHTNRIEVIKEIDEQDANAMEVGPELEGDQNKGEQVIRVVLDSSRETKREQESIALVDLVAAVDQAAAEAAADQVVLVAAVAAVALAVPLVTTALRASVVS